MTDSSSFRLISRAACDVVTLLKRPSRELAQGAHAPQLLSLALGHIHFAPLVPQQEERGGKKSRN